MPLLPMLVTLYVAALLILVDRLLVAPMPPPTRLRVRIALSAWVAVAGTLAISGALIASPGERPPRLVPVLAPVLAGLVYVALAGAPLRALSPVSLATLTALQCFRLGPELTLDQLWRAGLVPRALTWHGANVEILVVVTAPLVALLYHRGRIGRRALVAWNLAGVCILLNVVVRGVGSVPGVDLVHYEVGNTGMAKFPFVYIPALMVPLAMTLHVVSLRRLLRQRS